MNMALDRGASDLHITVNVPPLLCLNGSLVEIKTLLDSLDYSIWEPLRDADYG